MQSSVFRVPKPRVAQTPDFGAALPALIAYGTAASPSPTVSAAAQTASAIAPAGELSGHIVLNCQLYKYQSSEQISIMNSDGSGYRRLTTEDGFNHFFPSAASDGRSVAYSQYRENNVIDL